MKQRNSRIRLLPLLLMAILLLCGMTTTALAENQFHFNKEYNTVFEGETLQLDLVRAGDCAEEGELTYKSSSTKIATVDENGVVTGVSKGQVTITATLKGAKRSWTNTITVTVARKVESIEITGSGLTVYEPGDPAVEGLLAPASAGEEELHTLVLRVGKSKTVTATCSPSTATNRKWEMISSDDTIARVSGTTVTGRSEGECLITVRSVQNPEVCVQLRTLVVNSVTSVKVTSDEKYLYLGESLALTATVKPADATMQNLTWTSDREDNATVDENGVVTGVSKGTAVITAKAKDGSGCYGTFTVTVRQQPEEITLKKAEYTLKAGNYVTLGPTVLPSTTNDKSVVWSSSDESVVKVNSSGRVTAVSPGVAIVTCASKTHPDVYAQAIVNVYQPVSKVAFTTKDPYVAVGDTIYLDWEVTPDTATDTSVTFSTNKTNVVRVGQDGSVTGLQRGECYVYATANDGSGKKATIKVQVTQPVEGVGIKYDERTVGVGETVTNNAIFYPDDASITRMTWYSENGNIATVSGSGAKATVTGRGWGETTIIGVSEDGGYVTTFKVSVGDVNKPLNIANLYVEDDNVIRISVYNESNLTITRFYYVIETYDAWGNPVVCNDDGRSNDFEGTNNNIIYPGETLGRGTYSFGSEFNRPDSIGWVVMRITGYQTADGRTVYVPRSEQEKAEWKVRVLGE